MTTISRRILYMVLGGIVALAVVGAAMVGGTAVFAQDDETPETPPTEETTPSFSGRGFNGQRPNFEDFDGERPDFGRSRGQFGGEISPEQSDLMAAMQALGEYIDQEAILADVLGLTAEELEAAKADGSIRDLLASSNLSTEEMMTVMQETMAAAVAQAVADGAITQEQADQLQEGPINGFGGERPNVEGFNGERPDFGRSRGQFGGEISPEQSDLMAAMQALGEYIDQEAILADALGLTAEELEAAKADGSIRDLLASSDLDMEEIMTAMQEAVSAAIDQAVADGVITQEQADQLQEGTANGFGGRGSFGGRGGSRGDFQGGFPGVAPEAPSTTGNSA